MDKINLSTGAAMKYRTPDEYPFCPSCFTGRLRWHESECWHCPNNACGATFKEYDDRLPLEELVAWRVAMADPCVCSPGDGSRVCEREDECREAWETYRAATETLNRNTSNG